MTDLISNFSLGLSVAFTPTNILFLLIGVCVGMVVGAFPGFGPAAGIAILLPVTFGMDPTAAIIMLAGIYYGSMYGGSITSILINTPGEAATVASMLDGYPLARKGRAGPALVMHAIASFVGGTIGVILICALAPWLASVAATFGPSEYFLIITMGIMLLTVMMGEDKIKGIMSALFGFAIAMVGVDVMSGMQRFTFGSPELIGGIDFVAVAIGLFGIGELLYCVYTGLHKEKDEDKIKVPFLGKGFWPNKDDLSTTKFTMFRGSILGFIAGVLPGSGATLGSIMGYSIEKKISKRSDNFGKGEMAGLVAPEAANNAASSGAMVPLLSLGIPGSGATAVLLGAFMIWGLQPGPQLMTANPDFAWGVIMSMYLGNVVLVIMSIVAIPLIVKVLDIPYRILIPIIVVLCVVGTFSYHGSIIETWILIFSGVLGFFMKLYGYSPAAVVLALVLGPMAENGLLQSVITSGGNPATLLSRPATAILFSVILLIVFVPIVIKLLKYFNKNKKAAATPNEFYDDQSG
ncbi:tripartite tricarboxylate transporter permease [Lentibacillus sp. N15]|uniref:tripartite tricarboxylate transporter permease n=1 Tax=Lentibacillus songyuanensis TaxID=3136161 RepID=UPI0031BB4999